VHDQVHHAVGVEVADADGADAAIFDQDGSIRLYLGLDARAPRLYLVPRSGFSLGEYLLARRPGWKPVGGAIDDAAGEPAPPKAPRRGDVIVLRLTPDAAGSMALLDGVLASLARAGLSPVTVRALVDDSATRRPTAGEPASASALRR